MNTSLMSLLHFPIVDYMEVKEVNKKEIKGSESKDMEQVYSFLPMK